MMEEKCRSIFNIHKASDASFNLTISIERELPVFDHTVPLHVIARLYDLDAQTIFDALRNSLPGGTLDRLLGKMLEHKASHFRVLSWKEEDANGTRN